MIMHQIAYGNPGPMQNRTRGLGPTGLRTQALGAWALNPGEAEGEAETKDLIEASSLRTQMIPGCDGTRGLGYPG